MKPLGIGIIGCGKISQAYFNGAKVFDILKVVACADLNLEVAKAKAEENGCVAQTVEELLANPDVELIINLTIPAAHAKVSTAILNAGKHVYCEKPLTVTLEEAKALTALAEAKGLRIGCAPDTFLGAGHQTGRKLVDDGVIGRVVSGTAFMMGRGPEGWHPNPAFYYQVGGGPVFDMGPYYLTALVNLLGPVKRVAAVVSKAFDERIAGCPERKGQKIPVEIPTHASATLEFHSGAVITAVFSFDVCAHKHSRIELYGTEGSMSLPDPNTFGGPISIYDPKLKPEGSDKPDWLEHALEFPYETNMRSIGAADMAYAIREGRPHRASGELAYHVMELMHSFEKSSLSGEHVTIESKPERPEPFPVGLVEGKLAL
ncbi:Gfo/Idh/MocA family protein [Coraliomargarita parva]|uniref:Gfo/Idh/MocA family protein n=1 Tax=Coraliomargarita parva TaxID=3014050 RepID=UPI0022B3B259|nr:Gfo/Idh/MocA family oxidoreductase [Coraliomargarita parva]